MYLCLLAINAFKKVPLERVMSFEYAPCPLSLFADSGEMNSTKKSDFMQKLEERVKTDLTALVENVECILFDGMALIQMLHPQQ